MTISVRENLIKELKGKTFRINDLGSILPGWSEGVSPEYEELHDRIEPKFDMYEHLYQSPIKSPCHMPVFSKLLAEN